MNKTDGLFDKTWKKPCIICNSNQVLFFKKVCHKCEIIAIKTLKLIIQNERYIT
jgi:hypothetical protein